ncbi:MAG: hydrolase TatD [Flavobacteriales bacterium]|nr:hydrolase TatD [Flavobacteriales bacterium]
MEIIDTHTHLYLNQFNNDFDQVITKAIDHNITKLIFPSIDSSHMEKMHELKNRYPNNIFLMTGLHPVYVKDNYKDELDQVIKSLIDHDYAAVGEIGIDLYWDKTFLKQQQDAFEFQIELALEKKLPIVIHCRGAFNEIFEILEKFKSKKMTGIFHCFTGSLDQANKSIEMGFKLGIGGVVTFKNAGIDKLIKDIDLENIVLETDSPYLAPVPFRGKRNESFYITYVIKKISEIYNISEKEVAEITTKNSKEIFKI